MRLWEQAPRSSSENKLPREHSDRSIIDIFCKGNYKLFIRGYSPLCFYLRTKESYNRWVTRRVWGFRHQISKAKYLKMSVTNMGSFRRTPQHCAKMAAKLSGWVLLEDPDMYIRRSWNALLSHPAPEFRMWDIRVKWRRGQNSGCHPGGMANVHKPCYVILTACPYSLHSSFAYGFQRTLLNLGLLWW